MLRKAATIALTFMIVTPCTEVHFHQSKIVSSSTEKSWYCTNQWLYIPETSGGYWRTISPCELLKYALLQKKLKKK